MWCVKYLYCLMMWCDFRCYTRTKCYLDNLTWGFHSKLWEEKQLSLSQAFLTYFLQQMQPKPVYIVNLRTPSNLSIYFIHQNLNVIYAVVICFKNVLQFWSQVKIFSWLVPMKMTKTKDRSTTSGTRWRSSATVWLSSDRTCWTVIYSKRAQIKFHDCLMSSCSP